MTIYLHETQFRDIIADLRIEDLRRMGEVYAQSVKRLATRREPGNRAQRRARKRAKRAPEPPTRRTDCSADRPFESSAYRRVALPETTQAPSLARIAGLK